MPRCNDLRDFPDLLSIGWVPTSVQVNTQRVEEHYLVQLEMRKSLERVQEFLPRFIQAKIFVSTMDLPGYGQDKVDALMRMKPPLPKLCLLFRLQAPEPAPRPGTRPQVWLLRLMFAWTRAGRRQFGKNWDSPLVIFTQQFLGRAGIHASTEAVAQGFGRGTIRDLAKQPQTAQPQL